MKAMGHHMYMVAWGACDCSFIFEEWHTDSNQCGYFILGGILTSIFCVFYMFFAQGKDWLLQKHKEHSLFVAYNIFWYFIYMILNIILMLLMMTMNLYVGIFISLGLAIGYFLFNSKKATDLVENCCHY
ncbi:hypothetical protein PPERSA_11575 [Pseudocohnilembus persalinus]|uniref:Copper transporter n=1 Tax=Pseudocohnilembus persalinus TaxID=266149 RepID=A0A0V0Q9S3_PSEPJ|nr:hypothetical protein PPERSA_11575 [Pseudocohnilembus persalinus]|eukprot:KRW98974.1 hypothetical protein PPERSA_11575 [Pseudocohnilembus persalinus]